MEAKTKNHTLQQTRLATWAKALGHPARIAIMEVLLQRNSCICGELVDVLPLSQSTVSQHLKALKDAKLIKGAIDGPRTCYCIDQEEWASVQSLLGNFLNKKVTMDNCC